MDTLRGSYGSGKAADAWIAEARGRVRLIRCYLTPPSAFRLRRLAESACPRRVLLVTALSSGAVRIFAFGGHFS